MTQINREASDSNPKPGQQLGLSSWHSYLTQFFPTTANELLDRLMGILAPNEAPTRTTESRRYLRFREREPEAFTNHAVVAQWFQEERDPEFAVRLLESAAAEFPAAKSDAFFLSVSIPAYLDLGRFDEAEAAFHCWPESDRGHAYWKCRALVLDDVLRQHGAAIEAYDRALQFWPGPADWKLHHRKANCLARLRKPVEAAAAQEQATRVEALMAADLHERLREVLGSLNDAEQLVEVAQFYRRLGCGREADGWERHIRLLSARAKEPR